MTMCNCSRRSNGLMSFVLYSLGFFGLYLAKNRAMQWADSQGGVSAVTSNMKDKAKEAIQSNPMMKSGAMQGMMEWLKSCPMMKQQSGGQQSGQSEQANGSSQQSQHDSQTSTEATASYS